jgi:nucleotidyltransferase AbiEii toxin of type IV toxin-antitoxin system
MNPQDSDRWKSEVLDEIFAALAGDEKLVESLVFKGARILHAHLKGGRQSLDLDSNLIQQFVERIPDRESQKNFLEQHIKGAIARHFERQDPVRYKLRTVRIRPTAFHPMGWEAFEVKLTIDDLTKPGMRALPGIQVDVAAPEKLLEASISKLKVGNSWAFAYSLNRIAGEKMRAFLSSLPAYRIKIKKPGDSVRAKDLYDLARIQRARPILQSEFWNMVGQEFRIACLSRFIDCDGIETFTQQWDITSQTYTEDPTIPDDIAISEAREALERVVKFMIDDGIIPFEHPLPPSLR